jgi:hypothetical protein
MDEITMICYILKQLAADIDREVIDPVFNKLGLSAVALSVTTTTAQAAEVPIINDAVLWSLTSADIALLVSSVGGVLFCIEKCLMIYIRYQEAKHPTDRT